MMSDHYESRILSLTPVPPGTLRVLTVLRYEHGWWEGWSEPALFVALVERVWKNGDGRERVLLPVSFDINRPFGLSTVEDQDDDVRDSSWPQGVVVVPEDASWETVIGAIESVHTLWRIRRASREKATA